MSKKNDYWEQYYGFKTESSPPEAPSQFAAFIASEIKGIDTTIVEFGCGNGRDSLFFANLGYRVIGVDSSEEAIKLSSLRAPENAKFLCAQVETPSLQQMCAQIIGDKDEDVTVYARFFIHAIDESAQTSFLQLASGLIKKGERLALEFRTEKDERQAKVTPAHYRRFIKLTEFILTASRSGLEAKYAVEGFGFAKFRSDDAHVARVILESAR